jgi:hypothetical protein
MEIPLDHLLKGMRNKLYDNLVSGHYGDKMEEEAAIERIDEMIEHFRIERARLVSG